MCEDPHESKFIEIAFGWGPGHIWLHTTLKDPWPHYVHVYGGVLGRPLDTFVWAPTTSWSQLLAPVWSGPKWSCKLPQSCWLLKPKRLSYLEHVTQSLLNTCLFSYPFFKPYITTYYSSISVLLRSMTELGASSTLGGCKAFDFNLSRPGRDTIVQFDLKDKFGVDISYKRDVWSMRFRLLFLHKIIASLHHVYRIVLTFDGVLAYGLHSSPFYFIKFISCSSVPSTGSFLAHTVNWAAWRFQRQPFGGRAQLIWIKGVS